MKILTSFIVAISLTLLIPTTGLSEKLYKWIDRDGVVHVTDEPAKIPAQYRNQVEEIKIEDKGIKSVIGKIKKEAGKNKRLITLAAIGLIGGLAIVLLVYKSFKSLQVRSREKEKERLLMIFAQSGADNMEESAFKNYIGRLLERQGFKIQFPEGSLNLGVDFIAEKNASKYAVHMKRYNRGSSLKSYPSSFDKLRTTQEPEVTKPVISDIEREKHRYGCQKAMIITNGYFTEDAKQLAKTTECQLVDREALASWILGFGKTNRD